MNANKSEDDRAEPEMVLVPRKPTSQMIEAAYEAALAEDAAWVWDKMIESWLHNIGKDSSDKG